MRADARGSDAHLFGFADGLDANIDLQVVGCRTKREGGGIADLVAGADDDIDDVIVDEDGRDDARTAAGTGCLLEESGIDKDIAAHATNAGAPGSGGRGLRGQLEDWWRERRLRSCRAPSRCGRHRRRPSCCLVGPPAEREVSRGDQDEVAAELPLAQSATTINRRLEAVVGTQGDHGRATGVQLGNRRGGEQLVGIVGVNGLTGCGIDRENSPASMTILGALKNDFQFARQGGCVAGRGWITRRR